MQIPFNVINNLNSTQVKIWESYYETKTGDWNMKIEEGLWRRTQEEKNKKFSGWSNYGDKRRRIVHYKHKYGLCVDISGYINIGIIESYIWANLCLPGDEIEKNYADIIKNLSVGGWSKKNEYYKDGNFTEIYWRGSLLFKIYKYKFHKEDIKYKRFFPNSYSSMEIKIYSKNYRTDKKFEHHPWEVLNTGIRELGSRSNIIPDNNLRQIPNYFPSQVEVGYGPAIEAKIPPLSFFHHVYHVLNQNSNKFIFNEELGIEVAKNPEQAYKKFSIFFKKSFLAKPTDFYKILKDFYDTGIIVGPVITNNFDGLPSRLGINEKFIRRFDENHILPNINFHPKAKSLMVIGSHADRRRVRELARKRGLKVIYIDPEGYCIGDRFFKYPLESLGTSDLFFRGGADESFKKLYKIFFGREFSHGK